MQLTHRSIIPLSPSAASWRRGYAPDCKAPLISAEIKTFPLFGCQDKAETGREPDTRSVEFRIEAATALCHAIAACDPADAVIIMDAALADLSAGAPLPVLLSAVDEARWWAGLASPHELKAFALACYSALSPKVQAAFRRHIGGQAQ